MSSFVDLQVDIEVKDELFTQVQAVRSKGRWVPVSTNGKRENVSLTLSAFTALSPPSGASMLVIDFSRPPNSTIINLTLKGVTGDTGITLRPATNLKPMSLILPLGATPSIGILNNHSSTQVIELLWL